MEYIEDLDYAARVELAKLEHDKIRAHQRASYAVIQRLAESFMRGLHQQFAGSEIRGAVSQMLVGLGNLTEALMRSASKLEDLKHEGEFTPDLQMLQEVYEEDSRRIEQFATFLNNEWEHTFNLHH